MSISEKIANDLVADELPEGKWPWWVHLILKIAVQCLLIWGTWHNWYNENYLFMIFFGVLAIYFFITLVFARKLRHFARDLMLDKYEFRWKSKKK